MQEVYNLMIILWWSRLLDHVYISPKRRSLFTGRHGVAFQKTVIMLISLLCGPQVSQDEMREKLDVAPADFFAIWCKPTVCSVSDTHLFGINIFLYPLGSDQ
jgi:hypothetical protein